MGRMILQVDLLEILSLAWNYPLITGLLVLLFTPPMFPVLVFFSPLLISTALCAVALISVGHQIESTSERETVDWNAAVVEEDLIATRLLNARNPENRPGDGGGRGAGGERWLDLVQRFDSQSAYNNRTKDSLLMDDIKAEGLKAEFRTDEGGIEFAEEDIFDRQLAFRDYDRSFSFRTGAAAVAPPARLGLPVDALPDSDSSSMEVASIPDEVENFDNFDDDSTSQIPPIFLYNLTTGRMVPSVTYKSRAEDLPIGHGAQIAKPALISGPQTVKDASPAAIGALHENNFSTAKSFNTTSASGQKSVEILSPGSFSKASKYSPTRSLNEGSYELLPFGSFSKPDSFSMGGALSEGSNELLPFDGFSKSINFGTTGALNEQISEPVPFGSFSKPSNFSMTGALNEGSAEPLPFGNFSKPSNFSSTGVLNERSVEPLPFGSFNKPSNFSATGALNERSVEPLPFDSFSKPRNFSATGALNERSVELLPCGSFSKPSNFSINGTWNEGSADHLPFGTLAKASSFSMSEIIDAVERAQDDLDEMEPQRSIFERDMGATTSAAAQNQVSRVGRLTSNFGRGNPSFHNPIVNNSNSDGEFVGFSTAGVGGGRESPESLPFSQSPWFPSSGGIFPGTMKHVENAPKGLTYNAASRLDNAVVYNASSEPQSAATALGRQRFPAGQKRFSTSRDQRVSSPTSSSTRRRRMQLAREQSSNDSTAKLDFRTFDDWNQMLQQSPSRFDS